MVIEMSLYFSLCSILKAMATVKIYLYMKARHIFNERKTDNAPRGTDILYL